MNTIAKELLVGFDEEMASTRKTLARVPFDKPDWKPHEKSMAIARLAAHVATLPKMATSVVKKDSVDVSTEFKMPEFNSAEELAAAFDTLAKEAREAIESASDEHLVATWTLMAGEKKIFSVSRDHALRVFMMNHLIHHRAQLGVYLRLNDVPVPGLYGPSADEKGL